MSLTIWLPLFIGFNVLWLTLLALNVSRLRIVKRVAHGDGGDLTIKAAIRTHANGVEHVPIFALLLLALELVSAPVSMLAILVIAFSLSRVLHALGMMTRFFNLRRIGASVTYLCQLAGVVAVLQYGLFTA